jgi:acyl carrier protein
VSKTFTSDAIMESLCTTLGISRTDLDAGSHLSDLGIGSLTFTIVATKLEAEHAQQLSTEDLFALFECVTVGELVRYLTELSTSDRTNIADRPPLRSETES